MPKGLLLLTLAGLAVRIAFLLLEPHVELAGDESSWVALGVQELGRLKHPLDPWDKRLVFYPPAYPYFIAVTYLVLRSLTAVKWLQAGLGALLVLVVGRIGERAFSPRVGLLAAAITAFYPELVWFSVHFWSETLFMVCLLWALERAMAADEAGRIAPAVVGGALCGLAVLTRETALILAPLAACWLAWPGRSGGARARGAAFLLAALLTIAPWTARNWVVFHAFVPVSTFGALNLWQGNAGLDREELYRESDAVAGPIAQYRLAWARAREAILRRQPFWIFEKLEAELPAFWEAWSEVLSFVDDGIYGRIGATGRREIAWLLLAPYVVAVAVAIPVFALVPWTRPRVLLGSFVGCYLALHVVAYGAHRYHLPAMPILFQWDAAAWVAWREGLFSRWGTGRRLLAAGLLCLIVACVLPSLWTEHAARH